MKQSARWITLGRVERRFVIIRNWGIPGALHVQWCGRSHPFYTTDFIDWRQVMVGMKARLSMARLEWIAVACSVPPGPWIGETELLCLVKRSEQGSRFVDEDAELVKDGDDF